MWISQDQRIVVHIVLVVCSVVVWLRTTK